MLTNWQFKCVWPQVIFTNNFNIQKTKDTSLLIFHHLCNSGSKIWNFWSQSFPKCKPINSLTGAMVWIHLIWMHRKNSHNYNLTTDKRTTARHFGLVLTDGLGYNSYRTFSWWVPKGQNQSLRGSFYISFSYWEWGQDWTGFYDSFKASNGIFLIFSEIEDKEDQMTKLYKQIDLKNLETMKYKNVAENAKVSSNLI